MCYNNGMVSSGGMTLELKKKLVLIDKLRDGIDSFRPLKPQAQKELREYYRIDLAYSSNALEGNSLTESETKIVIEDGLTIGGKPLRDHYEAVGHSEAYDLLFKLSNKENISERDILEIHRLFFYRIDEEKAGKYRTVNVIITGARHIPPPPARIKPLMRDFVDGLAALKKKTHPVEYAALIHLELVTIHPFQDGNGRTARLLMNLALLQAGYVITIIPPVMRNGYLEAIRRAQGPGRSKAAFVSFIAGTVHESLKDYLRLLGALNGERRGH
jgi:Fic family protein